MDFIDRIRELAARIPKQLEYIQTEEATKNALVMPFIGALGYNVFDPTEVTPELNADVGIKKGEKVDYAILKDGKPIILFECKWHGTNLDNIQPTQLYRYFSVTDCRIAILTNGIIYRFFSDLEEPNKLDAKPFLEFNMLDIQENLVNELKKLSKDAFNLEEMISSASDLKYTREIKRILANELNSPSDKFVQFFGSQVYHGRMTQKVRDQFTEIVKRAFGQFISEKINERLKAALGTEATTPPPATPEPPEKVELQPGEDTSRIVTTEEELEGYYIIKAILRDKVDPSRIVHRDTMSYMGILLDNNKNKPICRLLFNSEKTKYIVLFDKDKTQEKVQILSLNDIYKHSDKLIKTIDYYDKA